MIYPSPRPPTPPKTWYTSARSACIAFRSKCSTVAKSTPAAYPSTVEKKITNKIYRIPKKRYFWTHEKSTGPRRSHPYKSPSDSEKTTFPLNLHATVKIAPMAYQIRFKIAFLNTFQKYNGIPKSHVFVFPGRIWTKKYYFFFVCPQTLNYLFPINLTADFFGKKSQTLQNRVPFWMNTEFHVIFQNGDPPKKVSRKKKIFFFPKFAHVQTHSNFNGFFQKNFFWKFSMSAPLKFTPEKK